MTKLRKKAPVLGLAALLVIALIGGTFAYFSQSSTVDNYLSANSYDSTITENFVPPTDGLAPGVDVTKEVAVANTGDVDMLVRVTYTEFWDGVENGSLVLGEDTSDGYYDGIGELDSLVAKTTTDTTNWVYGGDGYYYYLDVVTPGTSTSNFIDSIMLKEEAVVADTYYDVRYWDGTAEVLSAGLTLAEKDALLAIVAGDSAQYLISVLEDQTSAGPTGDYKLSFTADTVQAIDEAAATWEASATDATVLAFLAGITAVN